MIKNLLFLNRFNAMKKIFFLLFIASALFSQDVHAASKKLNLSKAPNQIPEESFMAFPSQRGTLVLDRQQITAYDVEGKEINRLDSTATGRVLSTGSINTFETPSVYFAEEKVMAHDKAEAYLNALDETAKVVLRFPVVIRENISVSSNGNYVVYYGKSGMWMPEDGPRSEPLAGEFSLYDKKGQLLFEKGSQTDPYFFCDLSDNGNVLVFHGQPGKGLAELILFSPAGAVLWQQNIDSVPTEGIELRFTKNGQFMVYNRYFNDLSRPEREIKVWNLQGKLVYEYSAKLPQIVYLAGDSWILIRETVSESQMHFILVDVSKGKAEGEFFLEGRIQVIKARIHNPSGTLYLVTSSFDKKGENHVTLESRDLAGNALSDEEIGNPKGSMSYAVLADYGDGVHWLVPGEKELQLLKPE